MKQADAIFFLKAGTVVCTRRGDDTKYPLHEGDVFGESALNDELAEEDRVRKADVVADGAVTVVRLEGVDFHKLLGQSLNEVASRNLNRKILGSIKFEGTPLTAQPTRARAARPMQPCRLGVLSVLSLSLAVREHCVGGVRRHAAHSDALVGRHGQARRRAVGGEVRGWRHRRAGGRDRRHLLHH